MKRKERYLKEKKNEMWVQRFLNDLKGEKIKNEEAGRRNLYPQQSLGLTVYTRGADMFSVLYPKTANVKSSRKV